MIHTCSKVTLLHSSTVSRTVSCLAKICRNLEEQERHGKILLPSKLIDPRRLCQQKHGAGVLAAALKFAFPARWAGKPVLRWSTEGADLATLDGDSCSFIL